MKRTFIASNTNHEKFLNDFLQSLQDLYTKQKKFLYNQEYFNLNYLSIRRWILAQPLEGVELQIRNLLIDGMMSCEGYCYGSEVWLPKFLLKNDFEITEHKFLSSNEYIDLCCNLTSKVEVRNLFKELLSVCGPMTKIRIKAHKSHENVIRYRNTYQFPIKIDNRFHQMLGHVEKIEMSNPKIIMIEGAPETVGEIHSLLTENYENKDNFVLIARSFPEEISATLAINWKKQSLSILPLTYGDEIATINLSADMMAITGGQLISWQFGDAIAVSIIDPIKRGNCQRIEYTSSGLSIFKENVDLTGHINNLLQRLVESNSEDMRQILGDRIQSLSNDGVELLINEENEILIDELDQLLKHYNSFVKSGCYVIDNEYYPKEMIDSVRTVSKSFRKELQKIAGFLILEK